jgi:hypothetical protein
MIPGKKPGIKTHQFFSAHSKRHRARKIFIFAK